MKYFFTKMLAMCALSIVVPACGIQKKSLGSSVTKASVQTASASATGPEGVKVYLIDPSAQHAATLVSALGRSMPETKNYLATVYIADVEGMERTSGTVKVSVAGYDVTLALDGSRGLPLPATVSLFRDAGVTSLGLSGAGGDSVSCTPGPTGNACASSGSKPRDFFLCKKDQVCSLVDTNSCGIVTQAVVTLCCDGSPAKFNDGCAAAVAVEKLGCMLPPKGKACERKINVPPPEAGGKPRFFPDPVSGITTTAGGATTTAGGATTTTCNAAAKSANPVGCYCQDSPIGHAIGVEYPDNPVWAQAGNSNVICTVIGQSCAPENCATTSSGSATTGATTTPTAGAALAGSCGKCGDVCCFNGARDEAEKCQGVMASSSEGGALGTFIESCQLKSSGSNGSGATSTSVINPLATPGPNTK